jgi:hypothetical protein
MVDIRLDRRLLLRIDPSDVIQDSYVDVTRRLDDYLREPCIAAVEVLSGILLAAPERNY